MSDNNGWADQPGVPLNPELNRFHWLLRKGEQWPEAWRWDPDADGCGTEYSGAWAESEGDGQPEGMAKWYRYLGPCFTPAEVDARVAQAKRDALEECIEACKSIIRLYSVELPEKQKDRPGGIPYNWKEMWENSAEIAEDIIADICAPSDTPPGTYTNEAEQERDEFFNRLGRVTEELRLPMDATASRIIEAIREHVDNEREACASVSVKVEVPEGAETWTPLEAWEEALLVFDEAFRDAIRSRALKGEDND
jgi:hypothetical protein